MTISPELRRELLTLPAEERQALADELYESLDEEPVDPAWEREWSNEVVQRIKDVTDKRVELVDVDDVHADLRAELNSPKR